MSVIIKAKDFTQGTMKAGDRRFGKELIFDGGQPKCFVRYIFSLPREGEYELWSRYASGLSRPVDLYVDGVLIKKTGLDCVTEGWTRSFLKWHRETCAYLLRQGEHVLEMRAEVSAPHIEKFSFLPVGDIPTFIKEDRGYYYRMLVKRYGFRGLVEKLSEKIKQNLTRRGLRERYLLPLGVFDGEYGYHGPQQVQIDVTNDCNNRCMACWCNSPLFKNQRLSPQEKNESLSLDMVKSLLDDLAKMNVPEVAYSGSGEPFMHPQMMEILEYTKKKGMRCLVNTNFTLLTKEKIDRLVEIGVDSLTVSLWAATASTYVKTHPGRTEEDFMKIKENLIYLNMRKKGKPRVHLYNVIFNLNFFEVEKMVDFAVETKSEYLGFAIVDTMPGVTDVLVLNEGELAELRLACQRIKSELDGYNRLRSGSVLIYDFDQFSRRLSVDQDAKIAQYDRNIIDSVPCYNGWLFARVIPNGEVHSCLKAHRIPTGSLYKNTFSEIWNSEKQFFFRKKTCVYKKSDPFFRSIGNDSDIQEAGCYKSCDDIHRNFWLYNRINFLTGPEKAALKALAVLLRGMRRK
jgi:MoaA/NifB/PqqE/SkfB family radical SAM enzyme